MMRPISARERRLVAVLILVAAIAAVYFLVVAPIAAGFSARADQRERLVLRYLHNVRMIATIPRLRRQAEMQGAAVRVFAIDVRDAETGREWLKERLRRAITESGGDYRNGQDAEGRPGWVSARASAVLTSAQLAAVLARLQNQPPWLVVESVTVTVQDSPVAGTASAMDVELETSIPLRPAAAR